MLTSSFIFLKGIGEFTERQLWDLGITDWQSFLEASPIPILSPSRKHSYDNEVKSALLAYENENYRYFANCLKPRDHWRLFETLQTRTAYLDIETTGAPPGIGQITLVGLYANGKMTTLIQGDTLTKERLEHELSACDLLVTFFGTGFDLPYLRTIFPTLSLDQAHFDLCFAARRLGLRGGLKHIEGEIGLHRSGPIQGLDGWDAVNLWKAWESGNHEAGRLLVEYNEADVRNLEPLAEHLYGELFKKYGPTETRSLKG